MARPIKSGMDYFPHDTDAANDEKLQALMSVHGAAGYAFYFILCERIYRSQNAELDISNPAIKVAVAHQIFFNDNVQTALESFNLVLTTALSLKCFDEKMYSENSILTSAGIKKRAKEIAKLRVRWRKKKGKNGGFSPEKIEGKTNGKPLDNPEKTGESKVKESKVNKYVKPAPNPEVRVVIDYFYEQYKTKFNTPPLVGKKDAAMVSSRLSKFTVDGLKEAIDFFLASPKAKEFPTLATAMSEHSLNSWELTT